ncbi:MAG: hypothetical protein HYZ13_09070 [Acidobacteria bacterium]|nr:hypothetical protein [Acidobacteriota bacterium]
MGSPGSGRHTHSRVEPLEALPEEERRRIEAHRRAEAILAELPKDRRLRVAMLAQRLDLFAAATLRIRTKDGGPLWPFAFNPIQMDYLRSLRTRYAVSSDLDRFRRIRDLIVKPRQLGFSTFIAGLFFFDGFLEPGRITVVLTHKSELSQELLRTYGTFLEGLPDELRHAVRRVSDSKYQLELEFKAGSDDDPPSRFVIATEAGEPWRGGVIHNLHASEAAWYKDWAAFKASFVQAVPKEGNVVFETTANGFNPYYQEVQDALAGVSDYRVVFYAWYKHPEYRRFWDPERHDLPSPEERQVMAEFALDLEQLAWRRWKQGELRGLYLQEYPETLMGAFLTSGRPIFDLAAVTRGLERAKQVPPPTTPRTGVRIWEAPIPGELYLLSSDVSEGLDRGEGSSTNPEAGGTDFSAAYVWHVRTLRAVAAVHGRIPPVEYARILDRLGRRYEAVVAVERNNHGHTVLAALEEARYPELYRHTEYNQQTGARYLAPGFPTNQVTRPLAIDALDEAIRRDALQVPDERFWTECHAFHRNERGKPEALPGNHDDRVLAAGIGVYLCTLGRGAWGIEGVEGADGAGFPRHPAPPDWSSAGMRGQGPCQPGPAAEHVPSGSFHTVLQQVTHPLVEARNLSCGTCQAFQAGSASACQAHRCAVRAVDPPCALYAPLPDGEEPEGWEGEFSEDLPWKP